MPQVPKKLAAARLRSVNTNKGMPYLASAIFAMQMVETKHPALQTMAVDQYWRLYYNPDFIEELSVSEISTCIIHECMHLLRDHATRRTNGNLDPQIFNLAADCEINDDLRSEHLVIPEGTVFPEDFELDDGKMAEFYYDRIKELVPPQNQKGQQGQSDQDGQGGDSGATQAGGDQESNSDSPSSQQSDSSGQPSNPMNGASGSCAYGEQQPYELPSPGSGNTNNDAPGISKGEGDLIRKNTAKEIEKHAKNRGNVPAGMQRWAKTQLKPKVNWKKELAASIRNALNMSSGCFDYTYGKPSRRRMPGVILPSMQQPVPEVAVVIDTSGSMSSKELEMAVAEVGGILKSAGQREGVSILSVDAAVHVSKKVFSKSQIELLGGGGTDMTLGIDAASEMKPRPDVCIVVTDGWTPWPKTPPKGIKVVAVLKDNGAEDSVPSWMKCIKLPDPQSQAA